MRREVGVIPSIGYDYNPRIPISGVDGVIPSFHYLHNRDVLLYREEGATGVIVNVEYPIFLCIL